MRALSRREFLRGLGLCGLWALGGGALLTQAGCTPQEEELAKAASTEGLHEALFYASLTDSLDCAACHGAEQPSRVLYCHVPHQGTYVRCQLCPKGCIISEGQRGDCRVRENRGGKLYAMNYGLPCAVNNDPIEKKPFFHFLPGTLAFSIATAGCNLHCQYCQNWTISQVPPEETQNLDAPPEVIVQAARSRSTSIAYTYSEPTIFYEYMLDTARLGRAAGLRNVVISAGYINPEPLRRLCRAVDAIKIDLKGFNDDFYRNVCDATLEPVLEGLKIIREEGVHLEIVNLVVPTLNDSLDEMRALSRWVVDNLGPDVPLHFSRFYPMYKLTHLPPTPVETVAKAREIALEEGVWYAYVGNVPGHPGENTYCRHCGEVLIQRRGFTVLDNNIVDGKCRFCGAPIPGVWG